MPHSAVRRVPSRSRRMRAPTKVAQKPYPRTEPPPAPTAALRRCSIHRADSTFSLQHNPTRSKPRSTAQGPPPTSPTMQHQPTPTHKHSHTTPTNPTTTPTQPPHHHRTTGGVSAFESCSIRPQSERPGHVNGDKAYSSCRNGCPISLAMRGTARLRGAAPTPQSGLCRNLSPVRRLRP